MCKNAHMTLAKGLDPTDLLTMLAVSRAGRYIEAAETLGVSHTTVSRRIASLERSLRVQLFTKWGGQWELTEAGKAVAAVSEKIEASMESLTSAGLSTERLSGTVRISSTAGFAGHILSHALRPLLEKHGGLNIEIVTATRRATQQRPGIDIEIVVGEHRVLNAESIWLGDYDMALYVGRRILEELSDPTSPQELQRLPFIYFVDSMLQVDDLDRARSQFAEFKTRLASTDVFTHIEATRAGAGVGLLPCFMADPYEELVRVLPERFHRLSYWLVCRPLSTRPKAVREVVHAIRAEATLRRSQLIPNEA
jgi:DNA-binding transcriptional LysR family regulator